jgi:molybdopterin molybdotransferase
LKAVTQLFERGLASDVLITSAGVSVGERDFAKDALAALGVTMHFWKVAIKPGKPLAFGFAGDTLVFGLPGNPTSSLVSFELFVRPCLRRLLGFSDVEPPRVPGRCGVALKKPAGLSHFLRVQAHWEGGALVARPLASQTSGALRSSAGATHLLVFPEEATQLNPGDSIELIPLAWVA